MSSDETENPLPLRGSKKRRLKGACDICRRKKIRCDSAKMPGNRCSNCIAFNSECTHVCVSKKSSTVEGYAESLELRVNKLETLLHKLCPELDLNRELGDISSTSLPGGDSSFLLSKLVKDALADIGRYSNSSDPAVIRACILGLATYAQRLEHDITSLKINGVAHQNDSGSVSISSSAPSELSSLPPSHDSVAKHLEADFVDLSISRELERISLDASNSRFFGRSSGVMLVKNAIEIKQEYAGHEAPVKHVILGLRRPQFWNEDSWFTALPEISPPQFIFPENDLLMELINIYFTCVNIYLPVLHRPTFVKSLAEGLHYRDPLFGGIVLAVCALASLYINDPRIHLEGLDPPSIRGWKWFDQLRMIQKSLFDSRSLHELQLYCLSVLFLQGCSAGQSTWAMVGVGIRYAQEVGVHRRKPDGHKFTVEDELWKRSFWCLVCIDRLLSAFLGRPCCTNNEDFDLDLPMECDDEFWEQPNPDMNFKQPPGKPSLTSYFNSFLKLLDIIGHALRTIYPTKRTKDGIMGMQGAIANLDSSLNAWLDSVPDHLRWDPHREDLTFFDQSASLYTHYYYAQILIHRSFIPMRISGQVSPLASPSLAICTNAARSCIHVLDVHRVRGFVTPLPHVQMAVFTAGIVLLLNLWGGRRLGLSTDPTKEMSNVHNCMKVLQACEEKWLTAGRFWDILYELTFAGSLPLPAPSPPSNKRERYAENTISSYNNPLPSSPESTFPRTIAGSKRVSTNRMHAKYTLQGTKTGQRADLAQTMTLPTYTNELARLPIYDPVSLGETRNNSWADSMNANFQLGDLSRQMNISGYPFDQLQNGEATSASSNVHEGEQLDGQANKDFNLLEMDNDTMSLWLNAPMGYELSDWNSYIASMSGLAQSIDNFNQSGEYL